MIEEKLNPVLVANLKALDERQPLFAQKVRDYMKNAKERFSINARETPRGTWWSGLYEQPFFEPSSCLDAIPEGTKPVLIMAGLGSPRYLTGILNNSKKRQAIVLLEPNMRMMMFALESVSFFGEGHSVQIYFMLGDDQVLADELIVRAYTHKGTFFGALFDVHPHSGEIEQSDLIFKKSLKLYVDRINYQLQRLGNSAEDTLLGFRQMAIATPWILFRENLQPLKNAFKGYYGVVLSAGPSLDKNIHLLKGMEDKLVIVAADTLLNKLSEMGIRPHFVCALERGDPTYNKYFRPMYDRKDPTLKDIVLVAQSVCFPQIAGRWPGKLCVVGKETINLDKEVISKALGGTVLKSGSSVAHMGMGILSFLGVDRIALVGQDLAFGPDGSTHTVKTAWDATGGLEKLQQRITVPGSVTKEVETTVVWKFFIDTFEEMIPHISCPVWDCTEGGALIKGTKISPLAEFLSGVTENGVGSFSILDGGLGTGGGENQIDDAKEGLISLKKTFQGSMDLIERGRSILDDIESLPHSWDDLSGPFSSILEVLNGLTSGNPILTYIGQSYVATLIGDQSTMNLADLEDKEVWLKSHREFMDAHEMSARIFLNWIDYALAVVENVHIFSDGGITVLPDEEAIRTDLQQLLMELQDRNPSIEDAIKVDYLHSRVDPISAKWDGGFLWAMGRHLHGEGRFLEATNHYQAAIEYFDGREICLGSAAALLKDRAKSLMGRDLCWPGDAREALVSLANAYGYTPDDLELPTLLEELIKRRRMDVEDLLVNLAPEKDRPLLEKVLEAMDKDLESLASDGPERDDVIGRYLVKILQEKSSSPLDCDPIKEVGEED